MVRILFVYTKIWKCSWSCCNTYCYIKEQCLSCAMALVHGKIKRVFCLKKGNKNSLSQFSNLKFKLNKFLNHRYNVYFLEED